ncbi:MAG: acyltransferase family protein [Chitinophagales bacterium]
MKSNTKNIQWIDGIKAFAIIAILLNHFVESFGSGPWFSNPDHSWPDFSIRMANLFPSGSNLAVRLIKFLGWLGDMGPGVFILLSGLTLTISSLNKPLRPADFYRKRLLRIYPLYVTIHLVILVAAKYWFKWDIHFFSVPMLFSILGLRFTDSLFFYINPSWWFIWLIIQMYFIFPFLLIFLKRKGIRTFLLITFLVTILSRLAGITGFTFSRNLYSWMTGIFAGTRLFEFTFGMYLGYLFFNNDSSFTKLLNNKPKVFLFSFCIYATGFILSWTYIGSLFSNILITAGLTGLFYSIFEVIFTKINSVKSILLWVGKNSFSVFLLHQPFMMYVSPLFKNSQKGIVLFIVIVLSFLVGYLIERAVEFAVKKAEVHHQIINKFLNSRVYQVFIFITMLAALATSFTVMLGRARFDNLLKLFLSLLILTIAIARINNKFKTTSFRERFFDVVLIISLIIFLITANWLSTYWILIVLSTFFLMITYKLNYILSVLISLLLLISSIYLAENYLRKNDPVEVLKWGEYPVLQMDSQTVYSLIPSKTTHLKYNNYDYYVKTNSLGFSSEEINTSLKNGNEKRILIIGDAFSMPEGIEYDRSYPFLLEQQLRRQYPDFKINIINAGVTGYGPNEEYAQLKKYIGLIKPDIVIDQFFVNDFEDIEVSPEDRRSGIGFFIDRSFMKKYFGNDQVPVHLGIFAQNKLGIVNRSFLYNKSLLYFYDKNAHFFDDTVIHKVGTYLDSVSTLCKKNTAEYLLMYVPGQIEVSKPKDISYYPYFENLGDTTKFDFNGPQNVISDLCVKKGIDYINTTPFLRNYRLQPVYFTESWHWNKEGHSAIAGYLFNYLTTHKLL